MSGVASYVKLINLFSGQHPLLSEPRNGEAVRHHPAWRLCFRNFSGQFSLGALAIKKSNSSFGGLISISSSIDAQDAIPNCSFTKSTPQSAFGTYKGASACLLIGDVGFPPFGLSFPELRIEICIAHVTSSFNHEHANLNLMPGPQAKAGALS